MAPQASKDYCLLPPDHRHIGIASCTSNGINSEQVPGHHFHALVWTNDLEVRDEFR